VGKNFIIKSSGVFPVSSRQSYVCNVCKYSRGERHGFQLSSFSLHLMPELILVCDEGRCGSSHRGVWEEYAEVKKVFRTLFIAVALEMAGVIVVLDVIVQSG
jgi:hypothetical protein